jgi:hypothetical protein
MTQVLRKAKGNIVHRFRERVGRRGAVLILFSVVFFLTGCKALLDPSQDHDRFMIYTLLPHWARFILWGIPALIGVIAAFSSRRGAYDGYGFTALTVPAVSLIVSYLISTLGYFFGLTDYSAGWVSAIQWGLILSLLLITSGWTEVTHDVVRVVPVNDSEKPK